MHRRPFVVAALALALGAVRASRASGPQPFLQTDLVSDLPGRAAQTDASLVNPWGILVGARGQVRVVDNGSGLSTVYSATGIAGSPTLTIPPAGSGNPTGIVLNDTDSGFQVTSGGRTGRSRYIFASEDGTISAFSPAVDSLAAITVAHTDGAIYKGLAIGHTDDGPFLFVANFHAGRVDVFDAHFAPVTWAGAFADDSIPAGFAPFNIARIEGRIYVTYAQQDEDAEDDVPGPGAGFLDVFDQTGHLLRRLVAHGPLNAPWGLARAPEGFGGLGRALLVGNFGNGLINAFDPEDGRFIAALSDTSGSPIVIEGLWGLGFSRGSGDDQGEDEGGDDQGEDGSDRVRPAHDGDGGGGDAALPTLFFTAGIEDEGHGLFGALRPFERVPDGEHEHGRHHERGPLRIVAMPSNPARISSAGAIQFRVESDAPANVSLRIYDASGRVIARPMTGWSITSSATVAWDGRDASGARVPAGIYYYRAVSGRDQARGRLVLLP